MNFVACALLAAALSAGFSFASPWKKNEAHSFRAVENEAYLLIFHFTGESYQEEKQGEARDWTELGFKLVSRTEPPRQLFGVTGWVRVEFLDRDGNVVAQEKVNKQSLTTHHEHYGFFWVDKNAAARIATAAVRPLGPAEAPALPATSVAPEAQALAEEEAQTPAPAPSATPEAPPVTETEVRQQLTVLEQQPATVVEFPPLAGADQPDQAPAET